MTFTKFHHISTLIIIELEIPFASVRKQFIWLREHLIFVFSHKSHPTFTNIRPSVWPMNYFALSNLILDDKKGFLESAVSHHLWPQYSLLFLIICQLFKKLLLTDQVLKLGCNNKYLQINSNSRNKIDF